MSAYFERIYRNTRGILHVVISLFALQGCDLVSRTTLDMVLPHMVSSVEHMLSRIVSGQGVRVSGCQGVRVSGCQGVRVSGCQGVRVSGCQGEGGCHILFSPVTHLIL